ncbi:class I adenylate-forming enzyme family protein [Alicyclobacillus dauci]|uniref:Acyl--CoA ligase n=1 Tax=Alicyclobacillus dauci TaxID=1475485 RepID=A0ABY6Z5S0_9BACL|nr:class I adenylate-forming enzyme family protein [Alicyclobacillus dauci]WAH38008.1 acyl--CoA ligase [Alicyclobacillus dauci]
MDLGTLLEFAVGRSPHSVAIVEDEKRYTYGELNAEANRLASSLRKLGIGRRDRVMVLLKNRIESVCLFWAVQKLGAIFTPINYRMSGKDVQYCINDVEPKVIVYEKASQKVSTEFRFDVRPLLISVGMDDADVAYRELVEKGSPEATWPAYPDDDIAVMLYTSGTTGNPKGVPRSHKNEYTAAVAHIIQNAYERDDSTFGAMPLHHTMGLRSLVTMCILSGKYVITPDFDAGVVLRLLASEKVNDLYMIPTMYHELLKSGGIQTYDLSSLRRIGYAGAPMSEGLVQECLRAFKPELFVNHYGSTEVYTITTCSIPGEKPGCAGKAGINQLVRLVNPSLEAEPEDVVALGEIGQVIVHAGSDEAFKGYWNRPDLTRRAIRNNWYFTGDLGYYDEDGDLFVVGRVDEMVISGGEHISPLQVEKVLGAHPKVQSAAIVGESDERWGQIVVAYVVPSDPSLSVAELDSFCKNHRSLSAYARPRKYIFVDNIPTGPNGKILRRALVDAK